MHLIFKWGKFGATIIVVIFLSCTKSDPIGKWDDNIKLSEKAAIFSADKDSVIITTQGTGWWLNGISLNENSDFDLSAIDTTAPNFLIDEIEFKIERRNSTSIYIEMTKNITGLERVLQIRLQAGDYFDAIVVTQLAN